MRLDWLSFRPLFVHPCGVFPRSAVVHGGLSVRGPSRVWRPSALGLAASVQRFGPRSLVGSYSTLAGLSGYVPLDHSVVVLSSAGDEWLSAEQREWLWELFEVPVFEQVLDLRGRLLATECEAHAGLHVVGTGSELLFPAESMTRVRCGCGLSSPRFVPVCGLTRPCVAGNAPRAFAASAGL